MGSVSTTKKFSITALSVIALVFAVGAYVILRHSFAATSIPQFPGSSATFIVSPVSGQGNYVDLQSAINSLPSSGGKIFVRAGSYSLTNPIVIKAKTVIEGEGNSTTFNCDGSKITSCFSFASPGQSQIELSDFRIYQSGSATRGIGLDTSDQSLLSVHNLRIENFGTCLAMFDRNSLTFYSSFRELQLVDCKNGISVGGTQANNNTFTNIRINPKAGLGGIGVSLVDARGLTFTNLDIEAGAGQMAGITGLAIDATSRELVFTNPWIENNQLGVDIHKGANRVTFIGGSITSNGNDVIDLGTNTTFLNTSKTGQLLNYGPPQTAH